MNIKRSVATVAVLAAAGVAVPAASASAAPRISGHAQLQASIESAAAAEQLGGYTYNPVLINGMPPAPYLGVVAPIQVAPILAIH